MDNSNPWNIINFIILRVQFQNFSGVILKLIILIFNYLSKLLELKIIMSIIPLSGFINL